MIPSDSHTEIWWNLVRKGDTLTPEEDNYRKQLEAEKNFYFNPHKLMTLAGAVSQVTMKKVVPVLSDHLFRCMNRTMGLLESYGDASVLVNMRDTDGSLVPAEYSPRAVRNKFEGSIEKFRATQSSILLRRILQTQMTVAYCVSCELTTSVWVSQRDLGKNPPAIYLARTVSLQIRLEALGGAQWEAIASLCNNCYEQLKCMSCQTNFPKIFNENLYVSLRGERQCLKCTDGNLVNLKRPQIRTQGRALIRQSFTDLLR
jgi:hypothetical protein